jgi:hypothetical protein
MKNEHKGEYLAPETEVVTVYLGDAVLQGGSPIEKLVIDGPDYGEGDFV